MKKIKIYVLKDPRTDKIRYVGKTNKTLNTRLTEHCNLNKECNGRKANWVKQLKALELCPIIELIDEVKESEWIFWEKHWIYTLRMLDFDLTNLTEGGDGAIGYKPSKETIEKRVSQLRKKVKVYDINGTKLFIFNSIKETSNKLSVERSSIADCMHGNSPRVAKGKYVFRNLDDPFNKYKIKSKAMKVILQCDRNGNTIKKWDSIQQAATAFGIKAPNISRVLRGGRKSCKGFIWKYYN